MCSENTDAPSLYLDSFTVASLLIFTHKCPGVIKSQVKYFLCRQHRRVGHFSPHRTNPSAPPPFPNGDLWKIRENYVNDSSFAESRERQTPKEESLESGRAWGRGGVGTSSGISLGNLWIIPAVLMKVVRIKNAEIQRGDADGEMKTKGK